MTKIEEDDRDNLVLLMRMSMVMMTRRVFRICSGTDVSPVTRHRKVLLHFLFIFPFSVVVCSVLKGGETTQEFFVWRGAKPLRMRCQLWLQACQSDLYKIRFSAPRTRDNCPELAQAFLGSKIFVFLITLYVGNH